MTGARHLYVHLPFCSPRCGYCDFVTVVGRTRRARRLRRRAAARSSSSNGRCSPRSSRRSSSAAARRRSPSRPALERLLAALPAAREVTVEANPETVTPELARPARRATASTASRSAHRAFRQRLLRTLDRVAQPDDVRRAVYRLRDAGFDNISLDLIYGIPGQSAADLERDLAEALALEPEHLSAYELEAKPGTRFTHAHGAELERQAESMESYFELVVETLTAAGYRWYETANFCRVTSRDGARPRPALAAQPRLLARARLPRPRRGRGQHNRESTLAQRTVAPRLPRGARGGRAPAAGARGAVRPRCARPSA